MRLEKKKAEISHVDTHPETFGLTEWWFPLIIHMNIIHIILMEAKL